MSLKTILFLCLIRFSMVFSSVSDEQYALMPPVFEVDDYDTCMMLGEESFYCMVTYQLAPLDENRPPEVWNIIKEASSSDLHYRHDLLRRFVCVPQTCSNVRVYNETHPDFRQELTECFNEKYRNSGLQGSIETVKCRNRNPLYPIDTVDYIVAAVFIAYVVFVLLASLYDLIRRYDTEEEYAKFKQSFVGKMITSFSIPSNWNKLKSTPTGSDFDKLRSVQGIRVYMTFLVIAVHTAITLVAIPIINTRYFENMNDFPDIVSEIPKRGIFMLSFHFMMSTWMLINSMLAKTDRNEEVDLEFVVKTIIKRYVRFLPTIGVIVAFYATWFRHLPFGPFWEGMCEESHRCRKNWWTNLLFIQNYIDRFNMCHVISWFLGVEMQYYIISLLLLMLLLKNKQRILPVVSVLLALSTLFAFLDHYRHGYPSTLSGRPEEVFSVLFNKKPQWHDHFASYHANAAGSIVGLGFGYIYYNTRNINIFTKKIYVLLWWISTLFLLGLVVFAPFFYNVDQTPTHSAVWVAISRPVYAIGIGLLVIGLSQNQGGFMKWVLEWQPLNVLAKLSYCVYIGHTVFQNVRVGVMRTPGHMNYYTSVTILLSDIFIAFLAAVLLTLFFEMPSSELANMLFKAKKTLAKKKN